MRLVTSLLDIYIWGAVCVLLFFLFSIARFYQEKAGRRSYYPAFIVAIIFFGLAATRYTFLAPAIVGDRWGDATRFAAGLVLSVFGLLLLKLMTGGRSKSR